MLFLGMIIISGWSQKGKQVQTNEIKNLNNSDNTVHFMSFIKMPDGTVIKTAYSDTFPTEIVYMGSVKFNDTLYLLNGTAKFNCVHITQKSGAEGITNIFQIFDSLGYNRFLVTDKGLIVVGSQHSPAVNIDGLALIGKRCSLTKINSMTIGYNSYNNSDTTFVFGSFIDSTSKGNQVTSVTFNVPSGYWAWFLKSTAPNCSILGLTNCTAKIAVYNSGMSGLNIETENKKFNYTGNNIIVR